MTLTTICAEPGCRVRIPKGRCSDHVNPARKHRSTAAWTKRSRDVREQGICFDCRQTFIPQMLEAHHVAQLALDDGKNESVVVPLCRQCHRERTNAQLRA